MGLLVSLLCFAAFQQAQGPSQGPTVRDWGFGCGLLFDPPCPPPALSCPTLSPLPEKPLRWPKAGVASLCLALAQLLTPCAWLCCRSSVPPFPDSQQGRPQAPAQGASAIQGEQRVKGRWVPARLKKETRQFPLPYLEISFIEHSCKIISFS